METGALEQWKGVVFLREVWFGFTDYMQAMIPDLIASSACGFNSSVNIPENCDFLSQFDPLNIIF